MKEVNEGIKIVRCEEDIGNEKKVMKEEREMKGREVDIML